MATQPDLASQHRRAQLALRAATLRQLLAIWPALDFDNIDRSWPAVEAALIPLVGLRRRDSAGLASAYYSASRALAAPGGFASVRLGDRLEVERLLTSLLVTGPYTAKRLLSLRDPRAKATTLVRVSGAVSRHVLDGGRQTLLRTAEADSKAKGWRRTTSGAPCSYCASLAGAVMTTPNFASHDHCGCSAAIQWT